MKVLHILYQSEPQISGSSIRSKNIIKSQIKFGIDPYVITSPFQCGISSQTTESIDDVTYQRTYLGLESLSVTARSNIFKRIVKLTTFPYFFYKVVKHYKKFRPDIVHTHAMFYCALAGNLLSFFYKVPHVYEIRSKWEINSRANLTKLQSKVIAKIESYMARNADAVVVISDGLKAYFKNDNANIHVVPNSINCTGHSLPTMNEKIESRPYCFGYIGSIISIEGLIYFADALNSLYHKGLDVKGIICGAGNKKKELLDHIKQRDISNVEVLDSLNNDDIATFYSQIDCVVNYRLDQELTRAVPPIKPLEAMLYGKVVIASDLPAMREIVQNVQTGYLVKPESLKDLVGKMQEVVASADKNKEITENAYHYVCNHHNLNSMFSEYQAVYKSVQ